MQKPEEMGEGPMQYDNEEEEMLFGPTSRPNEPMSLGARRRAVRRPGNLMRYMQDLNAAAESPDAPQELQDLLRILQYHTGGGR